MVHYLWVICVKLVAAKCPSCGANIKVDKSLKFTKCEYCDTEIVVEEAVENLLKVELKDSPTLDNYLKLGERYYDNGEFEEAYKAYSKAEEIEPDNPIVVLRRGLCRTMVTDYNVLDINSAIKGMKTAYSLLKKMKMSSKEIDECIHETGIVLYATKNYIVDIYNRNKLNKEQTKGYIERLEACLDGYIYLDSIVEKDKELEKRILVTIVEIIDIILGNSNDAKYHLSTSYVNELKNKRKEYTDRLGSDYKTIEKVKVKEKVVEVDKKTNIIWDIVCYITIFFLFIMFLGAIFNNDGFLSIVIWLLAIISFIPQIKRLLIKRFGSNMGIIIIIIRIIILVLAIIMLASSPNPFENVYTGEDGTLITIKEGKISIVTGDTEIKGTYHWESSDNDYYIHVKAKNVDQDIEYKYRESDEGGTLCLLENNKCSSIYLPQE